MSDFETMPAGPEMDRLIAEKVMGWTWGMTGNDYEGWQGAKVHSGDRWDRRDDAHRGCWHPSTDIAHAWEVMGRLGDLGHHAAIAAPYARIEDRERENPTQWLAIADHHYAKRGVIAGVIAYAETAPLAICRVALMAMKYVAEMG